MCRKGWRELEAEQQSSQRNEGGSGEVNGADSGERWAHQVIRGVGTRRKTGKYLHKNHYQVTLGTRTTKDRPSISYHVGYHKDLAEGDCEAGVEVLCLMSRWKTDASPAEAASSPDLPLRRERDTHTREEGNTAGQLKELVRIWQKTAKSEIKRGPKWNSLTQLNFPSLVWCHLRRVMSLINRGTFLKGQ